MRSFLFRCRPESLDSSPAGGPCFKRVLGGWVLGACTAGGLGSPSDASSASLLGESRMVGSFRSSMNAWGEGDGITSSSKISYVSGLKGEAGGFLAGDPRSFFLRNIGSRFNMEARISKHTVAVNAFDGTVFFSLATFSSNIQNRHVVTVADAASTVTRSMVKTHANDKNIWLPSF